MRLTPGTTLRAAALLFDMDGTLVDSTPAVHRVWHRWAIRLGLDPATVLRVSHGRRAIDSVRELAPAGADPDAELRWLVEEESADLDGVVEIPGAGAVLRAVPRGHWAVVTSAERMLARARFIAAGLPMPDVLISAEDVPVGKPDPAGYRLGAARLGVDPSRCIVFEDALAGLRAGHAAGARVVALATTVPVDQLAGEDWIPDWRGLSVEEGMEVALRVGL